MDLNQQITIDTLNTNEIVENSNLVNSYFTPKKSHPAVDSNQQTNGKNECDSSTDPAKFTLKQQLYSLLALSNTTPNSSSYSKSSNPTSSPNSTKSSSKSTSSSNSSTSGSCANTNSPCSTQFETNKYIFILDAFVNGFVQLKLCADKIDYEYIIEVYWSNENKSFIKRTFDDFNIFHRNLLEQFSQFFTELQNKNSNKNKNSSSKLNLFINDECLMPVLPANKKPFWRSHLKLAESREIELNTYVQRILKLPTKISHSPLVIQFFESQSSDPKPPKLCNFNSNNNTNSEVGSDSLEEFDELDEDFQESQTNNNLNINTTANINNNFLNKNSFENADFSDNADDDDDEDYDADEANYYNSSMNNYSLNRNKKKLNMETGLWWDEDNALNELTTSTSFEFGSQYHINAQQAIVDNLNEDENDELETLKTLELMLEHSDLFNNKKNPKEMISFSSSSFGTYKSNDNSLKRLSLH